jgi:hypothetical protein
VRAARIASAGDRFSVNRDPGCSLHRATVPLLFLDRSLHAVFCHGKTGAADGPSVDVSICPGWHCAVQMGKAPIWDRVGRQVPGRKFAGRRLRWHLTRVLFFKKAREESGGEDAIGQAEVGCSEQKMVAPANVAPGLAACACADRPASFSEIFHRRTGPRPRLTPLPAPAASQGHRVTSPGDGSSKQAHQPSCRCVCCPALNLMQLRGLNFSRRGSP